MTLAPLSFRIMVHSVKSCHNCSWTCIIVLLDGFTVLGAVKSPHACSIVVMWAPKILLLLKLPDWHTIFFSIGVFGCDVLPCPLVVVLFFFLVSLLFLSPDSSLDLFSLKLFLPFLLELEPLLLPCFNIFISAVMARDCTHSSDGVPQALSSSSCFASYLFSADVMSSQWYRLLSHHQLDFSCP